MSTWRIYFDLTPPGGEVLHKYAHMEGGDTFDRAEFDTLLAAYLRANGLPEGCKVDVTSVEKAEAA